MNNERSGRNRTLRISAAEQAQLRTRLVTAAELENGCSLINRTVCTDLFAILNKLPQEIADLLIIDPPYNLSKNFNGYTFSKTSDEAYTDYLRSWFPLVLKTLKPTGSVYLCGDWKNTFCLYQIMKEYTQIKNRITWQREKGRGAKANWKNNSEDIWFGTLSDDYYFDVDAVKQKKLVVAPYRTEGKPKDWEESSEGNFRLTCPGNVWDDISVPYWSMPENTDHPTQKPEKLIAKIILASCPPGGLVLDPFLGSGTTSVTAKKLNRCFIGIEQNEEYCCFAEKRLERAETDSSIQGYTDGVFWDRNTTRMQNAERNTKTSSAEKNATD